MRDQSPTYIDGAYCACSPPTRSRASGIDARWGSISPCRASSARLSSRADRTRSAATPARYPGSPGDLVHRDPTLVGHGARRVERLLLRLLHARRVARLRGLRGALERGLQGSRGLAHVRVVDLPDP